MVILCNVGPRCRWWTTFAPVFVAPLRLSRLRGGTRDRPMKGWKCLVWAKGLRGALRAIWQRRRARRRDVDGGGFSESDR